MLARQGDAIIGTRLGGVEHDGADATKRIATRASRRGRQRGDALAQSAAGGRRVRRAPRAHGPTRARTRDRKSTRLNSSHLVISYAVFCLKKKKKNMSYC